jgi:hypothetical protein
MVFVYFVYFIIESSLFVKNDSNYDIFYSYLNTFSFYDVLIDFFLHYFAKFLAYYKDFNLPPPIPDNFED